MPQYFQYQLRWLRPMFLALMSSHHRLLRQLLTNFLISSSTFFLAFAISTSTKSKHLINSLSYPSRVLTFSNSSKYRLIFSKYLLAFLLFCSSRLLLYFVNHCKYSFFINFLLRKKKHFLYPILHKPSPTSYTNHPRAHSTLQPDS
jgi:hypothetical protein